MDLLSSPMANSLLDEAALSTMEPHYPLHVLVCGNCFLVQLESYVSPDKIFGDYLYFSSFSETWLAHAREYCEAMTHRFGIGRDSLVIEIASNDGYLLRNFVERGVPVLGVEPAANVAEVARSRKVPTEVEFFGKAFADELAERGAFADLVCANNVLAHVPDINDFVSGFRRVLKPGGVATFEFPHLLNLMRETQFDTIYHEHFSYLSLIAVERIFAEHGLAVFDVEELPTHGGSLRVYACHAGARSLGVRLHEVRARERDARLDRVETYSGFGEQVKLIKIQLLEFFVSAYRAGKRVAGYGAPAKGNTLLNYCGIGPELLPFTVDRSPHKQGRFLPGKRIPVRHPDALAHAKPDYILILPWNLKDEIAAQLTAAGVGPARFVTAIPELRVL